MLITGGLAPIGHTAEEIYATTFDLMRERSARFYDRFPADRDRMRDLIELCAAGEIRTPAGDVVTPDWFRSIGHCLGAQPGQETLHYLLHRDPKSPAFAHDLRALFPFHGRNPLYYVLHESSMADGVTTGWASARVQPDDFRDDLTLFTGEHPYPWMAEVDSELRPYADVANILADVAWPQLYDPDQLAQNTVPVAATAYTTDVYVPLDFARETAAMVRGLRPWITSEFEHNGLRASGDRVLDRLIALTRDEVY